MNYEIQTLNKTTPNLQSIQSEEDRATVKGGVLAYGDKELIPSIENAQSLRDFTGRPVTIRTLCNTTPGDNLGADFRWSEGQPPGTYTDNNDDVIVPTGGDGSAAWLLNQIDVSKAIETHNSDAAAHPALSAFITSEADRAEAAADAAELSGNIYDDTADGLAATSEGDYFSVPSAEDDEYLILYRHDTGPVATEIKRYPSKLAVDQIKVLAGFSEDVGADYIFLEVDSGGRIAEGLKPNGTKQFARVAIGPDSDSNTIESDDDGLSIDTESLKLNGVYQTITAAIPGGKFRDAAFIDADSAGRVISAVYADGSSESTGGGAALSGAVLLSATTLPDGLLGENPNGGFTCTGLDRDSAGLWIVGNVGQPTEGSGPDVPSIVILHPDFQRVLLEIPCTDEDFSGLGSIQGVAWDSSDNTIWFCDRTNHMFRHIERDGTKLLDEIGPVEWIANGCAYDPGEDALWCPAEDETVCYLLSCVDGSVIRTIPIAANADQIHYCADRDWLFYTSGNNGSNGTVRVLDAADGALIKTFAGLERSQAIEGVYIDYTKKRMYIVNDGAFHVAANPPLALACEYQISL